MVLINFTKKFHQQGFARLNRELVKTFQNVLIFRLPFCHGENVQKEFQVSEEAIRDTATLPTCNSTDRQQQRKTARETSELGTRLKAWQTITKREWMRRGEGKDD